MPKFLETLDWNNQVYTFPRGSNKIILVPGGEVLVRKTKDNPFISLQTFSLSTINKLTSLAQAIGAEIAVAMDTSSINVCPKGCSNPSSPYCSKCGSLVRTEQHLVPSRRNTLGGSLDQTIDVLGNSPCPSCQVELDHKSHPPRCPSCSQALHWTCFVWKSCIK